MGALRSWQANEYMQRVGQRIAEKRNASGMTQERLAALIGLTRTSVTNMEAGRQSVDAVQLALIARALRADVAGFLPAGDLPPEPALPHDADVERFWRVTCRTCRETLPGEFRSRQEADRVRDDHVAAELERAEAGQ